jgi:hypothetical protein
VGSVQSVLAEDILARVADLVDGVQHRVHYCWELYVFPCGEKIQQIISVHIKFSGMCGGVLFNWV